MRMGGVTRRLEAYATTADTEVRPSVAGWARRWLPQSPSGQSARNTTSGMKSAYPSVGKRLVPQVHDTRPIQVDKFIALYLAHDVSTDIL
jgi:hypothetical protein